MKIGLPSDGSIRSQYGAVLVIAPWNYPFQLAFAPKIAANCAAGETRLWLNLQKVTPLYLAINLRNY